MHATLARVLADGEPALRRDLATALGLSGVPLAMALMHAELELLIVSGPISGRHHTYRLAEGRVPPPPSRSREDDAAELARRYAQSHALAPPHDFAWWSGLTVRDARAALERAAVVEEEGEPPAVPAVLLMPTFDETAVAYRKRRYATGDELIDTLLVRPVLAGGVVSRSWRRGRSGVEVELSRRSTPMPCAPRGGATTRSAMRPAARGAPERIRTSDLRFRRPTLYPAELRAQRATAEVGRGRREV